MEKAKCEEHTVYRCGSIRDCSYFRAHELEELSELCVYCEDRECINTKAIASVQVNPWKDASKEKPEEREEEFSSLTIDVFILIEGKSATNGYYNHKDESWCHYGDHEIGPVTHWMYIPEIQGE